MVLVTFLGFLALFFLIGVSSYFFSKKTTSDYLVAGKKVSPALVGLSAIATNNSGFMFVGMIGASYSMGLSSIWLMIGWVVGDFIAQRTSVQTIRTQAQDSGVKSFGGLLSHWVSQFSSAKDQNQSTFVWLRRVIGVITLLFLILYAAAQLKAGTKATEVLLGWSPTTGVYLSALIIFVYSLVGGLRASIWTDVAQSVVMLTGMLAMAIFGTHFMLGGVANPNDMTLIQLFDQVSDHYMNWFPQDVGAVGAVMFVVGWLFGGLGVVGQPQIVIRFMTLNSEQPVSRMQFYYYGWFVAFYGLTVFVGMLSRLILPETSGFDAEMALPTLAMQLMPSVFVGLMLAALFAATMSTVDSLILSCSASLTRDFTRQPLDALRLTKTATVSILLVAVFFATSRNQSVFSMVLDAWGLLASAFVPTVIWLSVMTRRKEKGLAYYVPGAFGIIGIIFSGLIGFWLFSSLGLWTFIYTTTFGVMFGLMAAWGQYLLFASKRTT